MSKEMKIFGLQIVFAAWNQFYRAVCSEDEWGTTRDLVRGIQGMLDDLDQEIRRGK